MKTTRRKFIWQSALFTSILSLSPLRVLGKSRQLKVPKDYFSFHAFQGVTEEGSWSLNDIKGEIPEDIKGTFIKVSTGKKSKHGIKLNHFFDGDAYAMKFDFSDTALSFQSKTIRTPETELELSKGKMLYDEFGTNAPENSKGIKNNPSINIIPWNENYLALSESGLPSLLDKNLNFIRYEDFNGTISDKLSFTAHPKFDPATGELLAYGTIQGPTLTLKVFRINPKTNKATEIYSKAQWSYFMIHDMIQTRDHIVLVIPPANASLLDLLNKNKTMSDAIKFKPGKKTRVLVIPKSGKGPAKEIKLPSMLVFHNINAYTEGDDLVFHSLVSKDGNLLDIIKNWRRPYQGKFNPPVLTRFRVSLASKKLLEQTSLLENYEFPVTNLSINFEDSRYLYLSQMGPSTDSYKFQKITKFDFETNSTTDYLLDSKEVCGEVCFVAKSNSIKEDDGYIIYNGYNHDSETSFLEILDAETLKFQGRINLNQRVPIGLHGTFITSPSNVR